MFFFINLDFKMVSNFLDALFRMWRIRTYNVTVLKRCSDGESDGNLLPCRLNMAAWKTRDFSFSLFLQAGVSWAFTGWARRKKGRPVWKLYMPTGYTIYGIVSISCLNLHKPAFLEQTLCGLSVYGIISVIAHHIQSLLREKSFSLNPRKIFSTV